MTADNERVRVAAIQAAPVFLDRDASVEKATRLIAEAGRKGASLAAFGEAWLPGYPVHASASAASPLWWELAAEYLERSIEIPSPETEALSSAAFQADIDVAIGVSERDMITRGSAYSTHLFIGREGRIIGRHRKLKPSLHERVVWADGDAVGMHVHERGYAFVSGLNGWEHQMVLPTYALAEQGTQIHVACWPGGEPATPPAPFPVWPRQHLLSRAFAAQAGAYVICAAGLLAKEDVPERYRELVAQEFLGQAAIIDPRGEIIAGPADGETIVIAECSFALLRAAKVAFDCAGHAARRDQLEFRNLGLGDGNDEMPSGEEQEFGGPGSRLADQPPPG